MTDVQDEQAERTGESIQAAMRLIDRGLGDISERQLVSTSEVADLLLDVRSVLTKLNATISTN